MRVSCHASEVEQCACVMSRVCGGAVCVCHVTRLRWSSVRVSCHASEVEQCACVMSRV